ncbi:hypothetical protein [Phyllobacterium myrsinacearum]|uniref:Uncharacterized protein n=1 Tax=Phyllobacterium myrsinacearum TaxID=28101 RepID=A0A839ERY0_9HYPH|nr:hypothetical protein [Phyllobacterium myrsinacearum]MBA8881689.1 hypothetical protein [Phyllobacterium myrsinacearum]
MKKNKVKKHVLSAQAHAYDNAASELIEVDTTTDCNVFRDAIRETRDDANYTLEALARYL